MAKKVKDLIEDLQKLDPELEVHVCDEVEGNDSHFTHFEEQMCNHRINEKKKIWEQCEPYPIVVIRW